MWHASGKGASPRESVRLAAMAVKGRGDATLGEWQGIEGNPRIWHIQRRLTPEEIALGGVPDPPIDIRGTEEERRRIAQVVDEVPILAAWQSRPY